VSNPFLLTIDLVRAVAAQHGFRVALIGGFALPYHGVRRATGDIDFLIDHHGDEHLHQALVGHGFTSLHRSPDAANYRVSSPYVPVDVLYARRAPTIAMLERAKPLRGAPDIPVIDVEGLIGLKLQAMTNNPARSRHDSADIVELLTYNLHSLDLNLLEQYFGLFDRKDELERFLQEARGRGA
jgi:hypothetical protein